MVRTLDASPPPAPRFIPVADTPVTARPQDPVADFIQSQQRQNAPRWGVSRIASWAFDHPKTVHVAQHMLAATAAALYAVGLHRTPPGSFLVSCVGVALGSLGATRSKAGLGAACVLGGVLPTVLSTRFAGAAAGMATGSGGVLAGLWLAGHLFEKIFARLGDDTATYAYLDKTYARSRLYHVTDAQSGRPVPVLELDAKRPFSAGFAHGLLLGPQIDALVQAYRHDLWDQPHPARHRRTLAQLRTTLTQDETQELDGLARGFNQWAMASEVGRRLSFDELLAVQLLPDICHLRWDRAESRLGVPAGCTGVMLRDAEGQVVWGRNLDWAAFGTAGAMSMPMVWKGVEAGHDYAALGVPGMIGVMTGWNARGVTLGMNVVAGHTRLVAGTPAAVYNRRMLRQALSADDARTRATSQAMQPLGPYHLMIADAHAAHCVSFYQNGDRTHHVRTLGDTPLWCLNWTYPGKLWEALPCAAREQTLKTYFSAAEMLGPLEQEHAAALVQGALQMGTTNQLITLHNLIFCGDDVTMRWSNGFAARQTPVTLPRKQLFAA